MKNLSGIYLRPKDCRLMVVFELQSNFFEMTLSNDEDDTEEHFLLDTTRLLDWLKQGAWEKIDEEAV